MNLFQFLVLGAVGEFCKILVQPQLNKQYMSLWDVLIVNSLKAREIISFWELSNCPIGDSIESIGNSQVPVSGSGKQ